ncbi:MAG: hypothetical protein IPJ30_12550 [Acidobacteria bacterium]|nr:hypothetical protein [Acidobacteriota bacterium]
MFIRNFIWRRLKQPGNLWTKVEGNKKATRDVRDLFGGKKIFDFPKPVGFIVKILQIATSNENDLVLDFFSGGATTAHAVMQLNAEDAGNRRFIMVQLPEETDEKSEACKAGYKTIAEIGKERIRRAGKQIKEKVESEKAKGELPLLDADSELTNHESRLDIGFRVLKIDSSNMKDVYYSPDNVEQASLLDAVTHIKEDRTAEDLLFQVLVDWGVDLSLPIAAETILGKQVFFVDEDAIAACFETGVTVNLVETIAKRKPLRAVFLDTGFDGDDTKINVAEIFKLLSPSTELRTI